MNREDDSYTGAQGVARVISTMESPLVFGMPGGNTVQVFDALRDYRDTVECVLVREESIGTVMGEAHGRLTGRPAVVLAQGAWILGAGGIGVMEAHLAASPVVILLDATEGGSYSHHAPYQAGFGGYGAYDLVTAMSAITKRTFFAIDPVQAIQMTQLAIKHATEGEPGPVAVVFHSKSLLEEVSGEDRRRLFYDRSYSSPVPTSSDVMIAKAAAGIRNSSRPIIISGNGARGPAATAALLALAEQLDIPVATTSGGKSTFPEVHPLSAGVIGSFGHDSANALVGDSDLIIAVGTKLGATDTLDDNPAMIDPRRQIIVQLDIEPLNISWTQPVDHGLVGLVSEILPRLLSASEGVAGGGAERVMEERRRGGFFEDLSGLIASEIAVNPRRLARLLSDLLPDDAIVTCDAGENRLFILHDYQTSSGGIILQANGGGGMGYAVPAGIAATYTHPGRTVVAVAGDGGFSMSLHSLMTAVENRRRMLVVVMDNQALGWVLHGQGDRPFLSEFAEFGYADISEAIGCTVATAHSTEEVRDALVKSRDVPGVMVLVVKVSLDESYKTLQTEMAGRSHEEVLQA